MSSVCNCCSHKFGGSSKCSGCKVAVCSTCKQSSGTNKCCKCESIACVRREADAAGEAALEKMQAGPTGTAAGGDLQQGFIEPIGKWGTRYEGVGAYGPSEAEFASSDPERWAHEPYQNLVKHVYKHSERQFSAESYALLADYQSDYGVDAPGWNGLKPEGFKASNDHPHPNYMPLAPLKAFASAPNVPLPKTMDPPQVLLELPMSASNDPSSYYCYDGLWTPGAGEDVDGFHHAYATLGSKGAHFFDKEHNYASAYEPTERLSHLSANVKGDCWLFGFEESKKVLLGALDTPDEILMEFDLPSGFTPRGVGFLDPLGAPVGVFTGHGGTKVTCCNSSSVLMFYDLESGDQINDVTLRRYDYSNKCPCRTRDALHRGLAFDVARPTVMYAALQDKAFTIVDSRMGRAARWVKMPQECNARLVVKSVGACDQLLYACRDNLIMYDLTAGKARFQLKALENQTSVNAVDAATNGKHIGVCRATGGSGNAISWFSWDSFETGPYAHSTLDSALAGSSSTGNFMGLNARGCYAMSHNHAVFAPWDEPLSRGALVDKAEASKPAAAPPKKGRRARAPKKVDPMSVPVDAGTPPVPKFMEKHEEYDGDSKDMVELDRQYYNEQLWTATGNENPADFPFRVLNAGSKGLMAFNHDLTHMATVGEDLGTVGGFDVHKGSGIIIAGTKNKSFATFGFDLAQKSIVENLVCEVNAVAILGDTVAIGGDKLLLYDVEAGRKTGEVMCKKGAGYAASIWGLRRDVHREQVFYALGLDESFLIDLRTKPDEAIRRFVPSKPDRHVDFVVPEYGPCDKLVVTTSSNIFSFDLRSGKELATNSGNFGAVSAYGSTLASAAYSGPAMSYYSLDTLEKVGQTAWKAGSSHASRRQITANRTGVYRRGGGKLYFFPFE